VKGKPDNPSYRCEDNKIDLKLGLRVCVGFIWLRILELILNRG
jgi:hypothetical protein